MTLNDLIRQAAAISRQFSGGDIPITQDIVLEVLQDGDDYVVKAKHGAGNNSAIPKELLIRANLQIMRGAIAATAERLRNEAYSLGDAWGVSNEQSRLYAEANGVKKALEIVDEYIKAMIQ